MTAGQKAEIVSSLVQCIFAYGYSKTKLIEVVQTVNIANLHAKPLVVW